jgi:hypothetical protein
MAWSACRARELVEITGWRVGFHGELDAGARSLGGVAACGLAAAERLGVRPVSWPWRASAMWW